MSDEDIFSEVMKYPGRQIVLTGGEPSLFIDSAFIAGLKEKTGLPVAIETNGTKPLPAEIDWVTVSPKTGMSDSGDASIKVSRADELKVVFTGQPLDCYFDLPCVTPDTEMLLQPCYVDDQEQYRRNIEATIGEVLKDSRWRLSLQTHKFIGVR